jgi:HTH-type transcriptional regulator/antitoxin HigA
MNEIKQIRTKDDYEAALKLIETLVANDPHPDSDEGEKLSLLATIVADYETKMFPATLPDPIEAIKFRMEQCSLKPADLIPYIGSRSRVSEILSGKRKLTIDMMRALESGLGIPAKVLLKEPQENEESMFSNWSNTLLREMNNRGYFGKHSLTNTNGKELIKQFFAVVGPPLQLQGMLRQSSYRSAPATDKRALAAWAVRIIEKAGKVTTPVKYKKGVVNLSFMQKVAKLSVEKDSPLLVQKYLREHGIILVVEPCFAKTRLDGAAFLMNKDNPIIGLTLRHDRLDNLWFTLMHELAHIALHYDQDVSLFYDELEGIKGIDIGIKEKEADSLAGEALVPASKWELSPARLIPSFMAADSLAKELGVHVAIVAGKIRYEGGKYTYLNSIVGQAKVHHYFPNEKWNGK